MAHNNFQCHVIDEINRADRTAEPLEAAYLWQVDKLIDLRTHPTYVIFDTGCTRSMGSMKAVTAFENAAWEHGITCEWKPCKTKMSFANSQVAVLNWCVVVHFPTHPPVSTTIDVHEEGDIPILLSLP